MSNELQKIIQGLPSIVETGLDADTLAVAGAGATGSKRISIKGRVFRKFVSGKEQSVNKDISMNDLWKILSIPSLPYRYI